MKLSLQRADEFNADFEQQYRWYADQAVEEIAERFLRAVADTLPRLAEYPDLGRRRHFRQPMLRDLYSFQVERPFQKILISLSRERKHIAGLAVDARRKRFAATIG